MSTQNMVNTGLKLFTGTGKFVGDTTPTIATPVINGTISGTTVFPLANGGTAAGLTASNGGIVYSGASALAILAGTATAGQMLQSGASTTPAWSTATYPATAGTSGNVLTSNGTNFVSSAALVMGLTFVNVTSNITLAVNTINLVSSGTGTLTLPTTCAQGSIFWVVGTSGGGWVIAQNAGQTIHFGSKNTTTGTGGDLAATNRYDSIVIMCSIANTDFVVMSGPQGNINFA